MRKNTALISFVLYCFLFFINTCWCTDRYKIELNDKIIGFVEVNRHHAKRGDFELSWLDSQQWVLKKNRRKTDDQSEYFYSDKGEPVDVKNYHYYFCYELSRLGDVWCLKPELLTVKWSCFDLQAIGVSGFFPNYLKYRHYSCDISVNNPSEYEHGVELNDAGINSYYLPDPVLELSLHARKNLAFSIGGIQQVECYDWGIDGGELIIMNVPGMQVVRCTEKDKATYSGEYGFLNSKYGTFEKKINSRINVHFATMQNTGRTSKLLYCYERACAYYTLESTCYSLKYTFDNSVSFDAVRSSATHTSYKKKNTASSYYRACPNNISTSS